MEISYRSLGLNLRDTFRISREASDKRENILVKIVDDSGNDGYGEAAPSQYYDQTARSVAKTLSDVSLAGWTDPFLLDDVLAGMAFQCGKQSSALAAVDIALHDLIGRRLGVPLFRLFGLSRHKTPATSFTIGLAQPEEIRRKTEAAADYRILKIKLGVENDHEIISAIRQVSSLPLRIDANAAWNVEQAIEKAKWLRDEGVELIEQPLPKNDLDGFRRLSDQSPLPIVADESAETPEDVIRLRGCVHGVNIKLNKCGGIRQALKMVHVARAQGMQVMLGCFIESSVGISAAAHLSSLADYVDLDGHLLIGNDPFRGLEFEEGRVLPSEQPGLGLEMAK